MSEVLLVADSGPLIALARLDRLDLPARLFGGLWVTAAVWHEVTRAPRPQDEGVLTSALHENRLQVIADPAVIPAELASIAADMRLGAGERSAIVRAWIERAALLMDERRGRTSALAIGLPTLGTLGLLVRARDAGLVPRVRPLIEQLRAGGYFIAPALVERTLAAVGE